MYSRMTLTMATEATEAHFLTQKSSLQSRFQVCDPTGFRKKNPCSVRFEICSLNLIPVLQVSLCGFRNGHDIDLIHPSLTQCDLSSYNLTY